MQHRPTTINRRKNWQLFDTNKNKHLTLNDIRKMIVAGRDLRFVDEQSGDDITVATLLHIITEKEQFMLTGDVLIA